MRRQKSLVDIDESKKFGYALWLDIAHPTYWDDGGGQEKIVVVLKILTGSRNNI